NRRPAAVARGVAEELQHRASVAVVFAGIAGAAARRPGSRSTPTPPSGRVRVNLASQVGAARATGVSGAGTRHELPFTSRWFYMVSRRCERGRALLAITLTELSRP